MVLQLCFITVRERGYTGLPRPKGLAMTGELIATIFLRKLLGGDTFIYALFDNKTNCVIIK